MTNDPVNGDISEGLDPESLFIEPRPDEDGWESFLTLALERIDQPLGPGLSNAALGELEDVVEHRLPFEVGLLLVMGVPASDGWHQWEAPATDWASWQARLVDGLRFDVEHNQLWMPSWGQRPETVAAQLDAATSHFEQHAPPLFPIFRHRAMPLTAAVGELSSDGNPVLSVYGTDVVSYGDDLAAWMHREFDVPLPMWPAERRVFPFWSELIEQA